MNVADHVAVEAAAAPDRLAILERATGRRATFAELDRDVDALARGLRAAGFEAGERALVMVRPGLDLVAIAYACFRAGVLPVLIDPGMGRARFLECVASMQPTALIGIPLAHLASRVFPSAFTSVRKRVTVGTRWAWGGTTLDRLRAAAGASVRVEAERDTPAAILFTSGSTGPAKGVRYTHGNFDAQVASLRETYGFARGEVDVAAFPLFSLFDNALGMTSIIPRVDPAQPANADPREIVAALREHAATTAFASPVIWRKLGPLAAATAESFPGLSRIMIAGASVPPRLVAQLRGAIPSGDVGTPYGATEALPVACAWGKDIVAHAAAKSAEGAGTFVGKPAHGIELRVIAIDDGPIPSWREGLELGAGSVGEICVRGEQVTTAYVARPDADALSKIRDGATTWHRMGDLGTLDADGHLWLCGRKAERVGQQYTDCEEGVFNAWEGVSRTALVEVRGSAALVVEGTKDADLESRILGTGRVGRVFFHPRFPVDPRHNSKIHRRQLAAWCEERA